MCVSLPNDLDMDTLIEQWRDNGKNQVVISFYQFDKCRNENDKVFIMVSTPHGNAMKFGKNFREAAHKIMTWLLKEHTYADPNDYANIP